MKRTEILEEHKVVLGCEHEFEKTEYGIWCPKCKHNKLIIAQIVGQYENRTLDEFDKPFVSLLERRLNEKKEDKKMMMKCHFCKNDKKHQTEYILIGEGDVWSCKTCLIRLKDMIKFFWNIEQDETWSKDLQHKED